jgi:hypothetical protein
MRIIKLSNTSFTLTNNLLAGKRVFGHLECGFAHLSYKHIDRVNKISS